MMEECLMFDVRWMIEKTKHRQTRCALLTSTIKHQTSNIPHGISLIEVLISMFVLLFGLMGAAALFPVGNFYAQKGEKFDLGGALSQAAMDDLVTRGMLRPEKWLYAPEKVSATPAPLMLTNTGRFNIRLRFGSSDWKKEHPGHAFVFDPLGSSAGALVDKGTPWLVTFPLWNKQQSGTNSKTPQMIRAWSDAMRAAGVVPGSDWPVRRLTLLTPNPNPPPPWIAMPHPVAETLFSLRDDLVVEQPKADDHPAIQRWEVADFNKPPTPDNPADDVPLARQFQGNYTWLATIVPTSTAALSGLQPADPLGGDGAYDYEVSVVVFRKRDITPSAESERLVDAVLYPGGEIEMYRQDGTEEQLDAAFQGIRSSDWIAVMGVHPTTGVFLLKWYQMLAMDHVTSPNENQNNTPTKGQFIRRAMLAGPDWPLPGALNSSAINLKVALLPGVISVATKPMKMESDLLWRIE